MVVIPDPQLYDWERLDRGTKIWEATDPEELIVGGNFDGTCHSGNDSGRNMSRLTD